MLNFPENLELHDRIQWQKIKETFDVNETSLAKDSQPKTVLNTRLSLLSYDTNHQKEQLISAWQSILPRYEHITLDLYQAQTRSIVEACSSQLPADALTNASTPYIIHVLRWDDIYFLDLLDSTKELIESLIDDTPALKSAFPFHLLLWIDHYTAEEVRKIEEILPSSYHLDLSFYGNDAKAAEHRYERYESLIHHKHIIQTSKEEAELGEAHLSIAKLLSAASLDGDAGLYFQRALEYGQITQNVYLLSVSYEGIGDILHRETDIYQALDCYQLALDGYKLEGGQAELASVYYKLGEIHFRLNKHSQALLLYQHALDAFGASGQFEEKGKLHVKLGEFHLSRESPEAYIEHMQKAVTAFQQIKAHHELVSTHLAFGKWYQSKDDLPEAQQQSLLALGYARKTENEKLKNEIEEYVHLLESEIQRVEQSSKPIEINQKIEDTSEIERMGRRKFLYRFLPKGK